MQQGYFFSSLLGETLRSRKHFEMSKRLSPEKMLNLRWRLRLGVLFVVVLSSASQTAAQSRQNKEDEDFGPVVRAYLGYLRNEQEVVDDRASRREISRVYYRRNSNRIRALRQMAIRIARESRNDYLPELEAVAVDEMSTLFERPPKPEKLRAGEVLGGKFRFLGAVRSGETFYVFARLDPNEQAELKRKNAPAEGQQPPAGGAGREVTTRPRRVANP